MLRACLKNNCHPFFVPEGLFKHPLNSNDPKIQRFLGVIPGNGKALGLDEKFAILSGRLGITEKFLSVISDSARPLCISRGLNALWRDGGLMYSLPFE